MYGSVFIGTLIGMATYLALGGTNYPLMVLLSLGGSLVGVGIAAFAMRNW